MLIRKDSLIVAVDGSRMSIFRNIGEAFKPILELVEDQQNSSPRSSEFGTDRPGRSSQSTSPRKGAYEQTDLHQQAEDIFAREIAERLDEIARNSDVDLVLVAAPRTLGVIRQHLRTDTSKRLLAEIAKAFGPHDAVSLAKMLEKYDV
ncbi:hypothetical protein A8B75_07050 [Sphingomonadales bacterium EhC05]|nr:hypothetical protein A8B75_07050 [Sphingomonadales bacterium EhC05]